MTTPIILSLLIVFCLVMIVLKWRNQNKPTEKINPFDAAQIASRGVQLLESLEIIATTRNMETLERRMSFINEFYSTFVVMAVFGQQYLNEVEKAFNSYKERYPGTEIKAAQASLLIIPNMDDLNSYFANCIVVCFGEFVKEQAEAINKLQRQNAINTRRESVVQNGNNAKKLFEDYSLPSDGRHIEAIEEMQKHFI